MRFTNPMLVLACGDESKTITYEQIQKETIELQFTLMKDLEASSCKAMLDCLWDGTGVLDGPVSWIMSKNDDISAQLLDGSTVLFTGYLSTDYDMSITDYGVDVVGLTIEDPGTKKFSKEYVSSSGTDTFVNNTAHNLLKAAVEKAGVTWNSSNVEISVNIVGTVAAGTTYKDFIRKVCFECGYTYYFNAYGAFTLYKIAITDVDPTSEFNRGNLKVVSDKCVELSKSLRQYRKSIVNYDTIATRSGALVYQDISGQDDSHPNCYIEIAAGYAYPSGDKISEAESEDDLISTVEISDIDNGYEALYVENVTPTVASYLSSGYTYSIEQKGPATLNVLIKNNNISSTVVITTLEAKATLTYIKSEDKVVAGEESDEDYTYEYDAEYIRTKSDATSLANLISQYYKNSNTSYTFRSDTEVSIGDIVTLNENLYSGLNVTVLVIKKVISDNSFKYEAVGISAYNLDKIPLYTESVIPSASTIKGQTGQSAKSISISPSAYIFKKTANGSYIEGQSATFAASLQNLTGTVTWYLNGTAVATGTSYTLNASEMTSDLASVTAKIDEYSATVYAVGITDPDASPSFSLSIPSSFDLTSRGYTKIDENHTDGRQRVRAIVTKVNSTGAVTWTVSPLATDDTVGVEWSYVTEGDDSVIDIILPYFAEFSSFNVTASVDGISETRSATVTGKSSSAVNYINLGTYTYEDRLADNLPKITDEGDLITGDYIIYIDESGNYFPYYWSSTANDWIVADADTPNDAATEILQNTLYTMLANQTSTTTETITNLFTANLAADAAFIAALRASEVQIIDVMYGGCYDSSGNLITEKKTEAGFYFKTGAEGGVNKLQKTNLTDVSITSLNSDGTTLLETAKAYPEFGQISYENAQGFLRTDWMAETVSGSVVTYDGTTYNTVVGNQSIGKVSTSNNFIKVTNGSKPCAISYSKVWNFSKGYFGEASSISANDIAGSDGNIIIRSSTSAVRISTDYGETWSNTISIGHTIRAIYVCGNYFFVTCYDYGSTYMNEYIAYAPIGSTSFSTFQISYSNTYSGFTYTGEVLSGFTYANGRYVANGYYNRCFYYSSDGINWSQGGWSGSSPSSSNTSYIAYGNGKYVAIGGDINGFAATSTDGITWTLVTASALSSYRAYSIAFANGSFAISAIPSSGSKAVFYSSDGVNWTQATAPNTPTSNYYITAYSSTEFLIATGKGVFTTSDFATYTNLVWLTFTLSHPGTFQFVVSNGVTADMVIYEGTLEEGTQIGSASSSETSITISGIEVTDSKSFTVSGGVTITVNATVISDLLGNNIVVESDCRVFYLSDSSVMSGDSFSLSSRRRIYHSFSSGVISAAYVPALVYNGTSAKDVCLRSTSEETPYTFLETAQTTPTEREALSDGVIYQLEDEAHRDITYQGVTYELTQFYLSGGTLIGEDTSGNSVTIPLNGNWYIIIDFFIEAGAGELLVSKIKGSTEEASIGDEIEYFPLGYFANMEAKQYTVNGTELFDKIYPVGSVYMSFTNTNPKYLFGVGEWSQITDTFLIAAGSTYKVPDESEYIRTTAIAGEATHTLTADEMPSHTHSISTYPQGSEGWGGLSHDGLYYRNESTGQATGSAGGGSAHNNMPPYLPVYMWRRSA